MLMTKASPQAAMGEMIQLGHNPDNPDVRSGQDWVGDNFYLDPIVMSRSRRKDNLSPTFEVKFQIFLDFLGSNTLKFLAFK